jgi:hypothetical protein
VSHRIVAKQLPRVGSGFVKDADEAISLFWRVCLLCLHRKTTLSEVKLSEGSEGVESANPTLLHSWRSEAEGHGRAAGRGRHMGGCTWRHPIGLLKSSYVI